MAQSTPVPTADEQASEQLNVSALQILSIIWSEGPISRTHLAVRTGLAHSSITRLTRVLERQGLIHAVEIGESTGGRPPILLAFNEDAGIILAVDLGSINLHGALYNAKGATHFTVERPFKGIGGEMIEKQVVALVEELIEATVALGKRALAIAISVPGTVDQQNGVIVDVTNLELHNLPISAILERRFGLPVFIEHDTMAAAFAEKYYGAGRGTENMVYVTVSQGIGAGIMLGNRLFRGENGVAGEIGHITVVRDGPRCVCGRRGCLEAVAGAAALIQRTRQLLAECSAVCQQESAILKHADAETLTIETIVDAAQQGDPVALQVFGEAADYVAQAIGALTCVVDVSTIIMGGEISAVTDAFLVPLSKALPSYQFLDYPIIVIPAAMHQDASIKGASMLALQKVFGLSHTAVSDR